MAWRKFQHIYNSKRWRALRQYMVKRARWRCERCDGPGRLEVHHKIPLVKDESLAYAVPNLEVLCRTCHFKEHAPAHTLTPQEQEFADYIRESLDGGS